MGARPEQLNVVVTIKHVHGNLLVLGQDRRRTSAAICGTKNVVGVTHGAACAGHLMANVQRRGSYSRAPR